MYTIPESSRRLPLPRAPGLLFSEAPMELQATLPRPAPRGSAGSSAAAAELGAKPWKALAAFADVVFQGTLDMAFKV